MTRSHRARRLRALGLAVFMLVSSLGNAPDPSVWCEGKLEGERCRIQGYFGCSSDGVCRIESDCRDFPETPTINECLICRD